jgi:ABC-type transport system substrate-binding protein
VGLVGAYNLHDLPELITEQLSRGLVVMEADGSFAPQLGDLTIEEGGLRYRFDLDEWYWQDGTPLMATEVNYPLKEAQVTYEDGRVVYDLPEVFASFPQLLTKPLLRFETKKNWYGGEREEIYGLSQTQLIDYTYVGQSNRALKQVVLDNPEKRWRFIYRFYFTEDQAVEAFKLGQVDQIWDIANLGDIKDWSTTTVDERLLLDQYLAVFFNNSDPLLTRDLRQALSYAVEKERPGYTRAVGPISLNSWAFFPGSKRYDKNIESGVERLMVSPPGEPIELELVTTASYYDTASRIKEDWEELGAAAAEMCLADSKMTDKTVCEYMRLQVEIQIQAFPDTNNFQTMLIGQQVSADPDQYGLWHSGLATNFTHYHNVRVDNFLEKGRQTIDTRERLALYQEFQQVMLEDPPAIFLWYLKSSNLARD